MKGVAFVIVLLLISILIEGMKGGYEPKVVYGTIISDGVINISRGVTGPIDPCVMVACEDSILAKVYVNNEAFSAGYHNFAKGERVKISRTKVMALIPFMGSNEYDGIFEK